MAKNNKVCYIHMVTTSLDVALILTSQNDKGGQGKSLCAVYLSHWLSTMGSTVLIDCDRNLSSKFWCKDAGFPFDCITESDSPMYLSTHQPDFIYLDGQARIDDTHLESLAKTYCIVPCVPHGMDLDVTVRFTRKLEQFGVRYRVLLNMCPPKPSLLTDRTLRALENAGIPTFPGGLTKYRAYVVASEQKRIPDNPKIRAQWAPILKTISEDLNLG